MAALAPQTVLDVRHWTDRLFSFKTTRDASFRFENGQFVMIGLAVNGKPLLRAYSMASANHEESLEFFSIKVPNGPLTSQLSKISKGDEILVGAKPTGTLVQASLLPGKRLYLVATGTGVAPFTSVIKDPEIYERFDVVVLIHGCRFIEELSFGREVVESLKDDEYLSEIIGDRLIYYPTVTREDYLHRGRVTELLDTGIVARDTGLPALDAAEDRVMICGGPAVLADMCGLLDARGFEEGALSKPGTYVIEKAFVER
ncbi:ferredoxin--NADP+ reductase [Rhodoligotrophos appendicifer]|uniref:ferredoxin--NADP reductase n=1 Tax=Rhodoligotrophos appendicifer TaxID=987056 RepID=UPI0011848A8D|nr:ferredoxin--NADP reductase [Rhodoligotrophos appendicifer]